MPTDSGAGSRTADILLDAMPALQRELTSAPPAPIAASAAASSSRSRTARSRGDPDHPANLGRLCSKGAALGETLGLTPAGCSTPHDRRRGARAGTRRSTWSPRGFAETIAEHGPDSVAFYVSGQFLTEDYYVANKLMKGFIGTATSTPIRGCAWRPRSPAMSAPSARTSCPASTRTWDEADLVVLVGSNAAWCHPVLYQRLHGGARGARHEDRRHRSAPHRDRRGRRSASADRARQRRRAVQRPAGVSERDRRDRPRLGSRDHVAGLTAALAAARDRGADMRSTAAAGDAASIRELLETFYDLFAATERVLTVFSPGRQPVARPAPTRSTRSSTAISPPAGSAGRAWDRSRSPASPTRWAGARSAAWPTSSPRICASTIRPTSTALRPLLAGAAHWRRKPGLKAVDMFDAVARRPDQGDLDRGDQSRRQHAARRPGARGAGSAARSSSSPIAGRPTPRRFADVVLPAAGWGEKDGTVTNSERRISRQRAFRAPPGEARARLVDQFAEVGRRMGWARRLRLRTAGRDLSRARGAVGLRERRRARFRHRRAGRA